MVDVKESSAPIQRDSESSGITGGVWIPSWEEDRLYTGKRQIRVLGFSKTDFVMSFDQLRQLDGYWLLMMLFKDLQGKKDRPTLQISGLSKLP